MRAAQKKSMIVLFGYCVTTMHSYSFQSWYLRRKIDRRFPCRSLARSEFSQTKRLGSQVIARPSYSRVIRRENRPQKQLWPMGSNNRNKFTPYGDVLK